VTCKRERGGKGGKPWYKEKVRGRGHIGEADKVTDDDGQKEKPDQKG